MAKKSIPELKEYFKAAKRPTENQFGDLIDSFTHWDDPNVFSSHYKEKSNLRFTFPNQKADQAIDILLGNVIIHGWIEVEVAGFYNFQNSVGTIKKQIVIGAFNDNDIWRPPLSRIIEASGEIVDNIYVGDIIWDAAIKQYKITIYHTNPSGNDYAVRLVHHSTANAVVDKAVLSDIYTNVLTGQNKHYVHYNGNVGIGTNVPETSLHVKAPKDRGHSNVVGGLFDRSEAAGGSNIVQLKYHSTADLELNSFYSGTNFRYGSYGDFNIVNNIDDGTYGAINMVTKKQTRLSVMPNGNIGIGTTTPAAKLNIVSGYNDPDQAGTLMLGDATQVNLRFGCTDRYSWIQGHGTSPLHINPLGNTLILNRNGGNVGIGTNNPDQKLTVKGKIHAEDVIVDTNVPADYVFQKYFDGQSSIRPDYQMPTIHELESFVRENKHLPEIPSGEAIVKEGVSLGDFQMKLLQKIEELTLYVISQNKEIENLKTIIKK